MSDTSPGPKTAFVLAGGGTKGSFEVGALQYLVEVEGVIPDIVTATSAGAIAATVLAQARTHSEFVQRVEEIDADIMAMTRTEFVFGEQAWLKALDGTSLGGAIQFALTEGTRPPVPGDEFDHQPEFDRSIDGDADDDDDDDGLAVDVPATSGTSPSPRQIRRATLKARRQRQRRMLRMVVGAGLRLPKMRRKLRVSGSSAMNLQPLADALRRGGPSGIRPIDQSLISRPGLQLRLAVTALRAGVLRYVTEDGTIVEADGHTPAPGRAAGPVDLVDAAVASASVPLIFPPHAMADDDYVDGGVLQIIPVRAAALLGAERIIAIVAMPLALPREERNYVDGPASYVGIRAMGMIGLADRQRENLDVPLPAGATLTTIDPVVDVVGLFEVQPGLLRINRDYGWLRAADLLAEGDAAILADMAAGTDVLTRARVRAWHLEDALWSGGLFDAVRDAGAWAQLRDLKARIRDVVDQRKQLGFPVPDDCAAWWTEYEVHADPRPTHLPASPEPRP